MQVLFSALGAGAISAGVVELAARAALPSLDSDVRDRRDSLSYRGHLGVA